MALSQFVELRIVSDVMEKAAFVFRSTQTGRKYVPKIAICHRVIRRMRLVSAMGLGK